MGICETVTNRKNYNSNYSELDDTGLSSKVLNKNEKLLKIKEKKSDYVIPQNICKRDDITKYYKLTQKILGEGATGQVCIGQKNGKEFAIKRIKKKKFKTFT